MEDDEDNLEISMNLDREAYEDADEIPSRITSREPYSDEMDELAPQIAKRIENKIKDYDRVKIAAAFDGEWECQNQQCQSTEPEVHHEMMRGQISRLLQRDSDVIDWDTDIHLVESADEDTNVKPGRILFLKDAIDIFEKLTHHEKLVTPLCRECHRGQEGMGPHGKQKDGDIGDETDEQDGDVTLITVQNSYNRIKDIWEGHLMPVIDDVLSNTSLSELTNKLRVSVQDELRHLAERITELVGNNITSAIPGSVTDTVGTGDAQKAVNHDIPNLQRCIRNVRRLLDEESDGRFYDAVDTFAANRSGQKFRSRLTKFQNFIRRYEQLLNTYVERKTR